MRLRDDYVKDAAGGVGRWNKIIEKAGVSFELELPHEAFHRKIGVFANKLISPEGKTVSGAEWDKSVNDWLPTMADGDFMELPALFVADTLDALVAVEDQAVGRHRASGSLNPLTHSQENSHDPDGERARCR